MKKITSLLLGIVVFTSFANAQTTIFKETFGTTQLTRGTCTSVAVPGTAEPGKYDPQKNELFTDHDWSADSHIWNEGITYSQTSTISITAGACDDSGTTLNIRTNKPSTDTSIGGNANASGLGNLYFNSNSSNSFTINGINTTLYSNITLAFAIFGKSSGDSKKIVVEYSDNGGALTSIATTNIAALTSAAGKWEFISGVVIPTSNNLNIKFSTPNLGEIRVDDIIIKGTSTLSAINALSSDNRKVFASNSTITLNGFSTGNVEIYNMQGKRVFTSELKEAIQPELAKGLYIVRIGDFRQKISL